MTAARRLSSPPPPGLSVEQAYDLAAPFYDLWKWQDLWRRAELPFIRSVIDELGGDRLRLLDVGCGTGWYLEQLQGLCDAIVGVDVSEGMLAFARRRVPAGTFLHASADRLPFDSDAFTTVLSTRVLSHLPEPRKALAEMARVLTSKGLLILSNVDASHPYTLTRLPVPNGHILTDTYKHSRALLAEELAEAGFRHQRSMLIEESGSTTPIIMLSDVASRPVAGWISIWRRGERVQPDDSSRRCQIKCT